MHKSRAFHRVPDAGTKRIAVSEKVEVNIGPRVKLWLGTRAIIQVIYARPPGVLRQGGDQMETHLDGAGVFVLRSAYSVETGTKTGRAGRFNGRGGSCLVRPVTRMVSASSGHLLRAAHNLAEANRGCLVIDDSCWL